MTAVIGMQTGNIMCDRDRYSTLTISAGVVVLLLGLYVGAYYWAVRPTEVRFQSLLGRSWASTLTMYRWEPDHLSANPTPTIWRQFFAPMNWIDQRIRPNVWKPMPHPSWFLQ